MSAEPKLIIEGRRAQRDHAEREWLEASRRSLEAHDRYMEAERAYQRSLLSAPVMGRAVRFEIVEEETGA